MGFQLDFIVTMAKFEQIRNYFVSRNVGNWRSDHHQARVVEAHVKSSVTFSLAPAAQTIGNLIRAREGLFGILYS